MKKKKRKITKREKFKIMVFIVSLLFFKEILSDWEHFKQGLLGLPYL